MLPSKASLSFTKNRPHSASLWGGGGGWWVLEDMLLAGHESIGKGVPSGALFPHVKWGSCSLRNFPALKSRDSQWAKKIQLLSKLLRMAEWSYLSKVPQQLIAQRRT